MSKLDIIKEYIQLLVKTYELEEVELLNIWTSHYPIDEPVVSTLHEAKVNSPSLNKLKKNELAELCKKAGLSTKGTKEILKNRLLGKEVVVAKNGQIPEILAQLAKNRGNIHIRRNIYNNYEHVESGLVFDEHNETVIGKQNEDGTILCLSEKDIEICKQLGFKYDIPTTLNLDKPYDDEIM